MTGQASAPPRLFGLSIGINDYPGDDNDLLGAVADARDIALTLRRLGATRAEQLINQAAHKAAIMERWRALLTEARAGDTIVFSFAGLGGVEPAPADAAGGTKRQNENFLLAGYAATGPATNERIVDDELWTWFLEAERKGVRVLFVADTCHRGALQRQGNAKRLRLRAGTFPPPIEDQLLLPPAIAARWKPIDFRHVLFLRASEPAYCVSEVPISGRRRGALSWAFARAIEGGADADRDGVITLAELSQSVTATVMARTEGQQVPQILTKLTAQSKLFSYDLDFVPQGFEPTPPLRIYVEQGGIDALNGLPFVEPARSLNEADLIWNLATGDVSHVIGGRVALGIGRQEMPFVASKWSAIQWLQHNARYVAPFELPYGTNHYPVGSKVLIRLSGGRLPYLTLFNLPPDGKVQFFLPDPRHPWEASKDWRQRIFEEGFAVSEPPFGAEHMVAIFTEEIVYDLHQRLREMTTPEKALALRQALQQSLQGRKFQLGLVSIYTTSEP